MKTFKVAYKLGNEFTLKTIQCESFYRSDDEYKFMNGDDNKSLVMLITASNLISIELINSSDGLSE